MSDQPRFAVSSGPPAAEPVALADMCNWLRVNAGDDDAKIAALITAARRYCETYTGRVCVATPVTVTYDRFPLHPASWPLGTVMLRGWPFDSPGCPLLVPRSPLFRVVSLQYLACDQSLVTLDPRRYVVDAQSEPGRVMPAPGYSWPSTQGSHNAVTLNIIAGYVSAAAVPSDMKTAIMLLVGHFYDNPGGYRQIPPTRTPESL